MVFHAIVSLTMTAVAATSHVARQIIDAAAIGDASLLTPELLAGKSGTLELEEHELEEFAAVKNAALKLAANGGHELAVAALLVAAGSGATTALEVTVSEHELAHPFAKMRPWHLLPSGINGPAPTTVRRMQSAACGDDRLIVASADHVGWTHAEGCVALGLCAVASRSGCASSHPVLQGVRWAQALASC